MTSPFPQSTQIELNFSPSPQTISPARIPLLSRRWAGYVFARACPPSRLRMRTASGISDRARRSNVLRDGS